MPGSLRTTPQHVASVGLTVDGREITEQDVDDIVETYNLELYGARINLDHYGNWGAWAAESQGIDLNGCMLGDVMSVAKGKSKDGTTVLTAILCPNESLLKLNQADQAVYYSIEIARDFMGTGKTYLTGLAMTDYPASTRTTRAKFNKNSAENENIIERSVLSIEAESEFKFKSFIKNIFHNEKDDEMKPEQFAQLQSALTEPLSQIATGFTAMQTSMQNIEEKFSKETPVIVEENQPDENENTQFSLNDNEDFKNVQSQLAQVSKDIGSLTTAFKKATSEPGEHTTDVDDNNVDADQFTSESGQPLL